VESRPSLLIISRVLNRAGGVPISAEKQISSTIPPPPLFTAWTGSEPSVTAGASVDSGVSLGTGFIAHEKSRKTTIIAAITLIVKI
jgi:hypothetical protein